LKRFGQSKVFILNEKKKRTINNMPNVVVIGGGASGLMAAGTAAYYGANVTLLEKNSRTGRKILVTGKGRCNITNNCDKDTFIDTTFMEKIEPIKVSINESTGQVQTMEIYRFLKSLILPL
jgi:succinate dehydrogenase/fumarate reductase flavoprotein subunit